MLLFFILNSASQFNIDQNIPESYNLVKVKRKAVTKGVSAKLPKKFNIHFYKSDTGREPVKEYLEKLKQSKNFQDQKLLLEIITYITLLSERGSNLGIPYVKHLRDELWELRPKSDRILYCCINNNNIYLLHNFKKTSQKTPLKEIKTALQRYKKLVSKTKR